MRGKARKTGTGRGEKKIRKKFGKSYNREEQEGGRGKKRERKRERALVPAVLKSFQTSTVIPGYAI